MVFLIHVVECKWKEHWIRPDHGCLAITFSMAIGIREETATDHRALARLQYFLGPQDILLLAIQRRISRLHLHGSGASEAILP
jgi:hypothetical protein